MWERACAGAVGASVCGGAGGGEHVRGAGGGEPGGASMGCLAVNKWSKPG